MTDIPLYAAVAMQLTARSVASQPDRAATRAAMLAHIDVVAAQTPAWAVVRDAILEQIAPR